MAQQQIDFDPNVDYYKALGVTDKATADEIKRAYRKLAKANHPDSTGGDKAKESRFKDISNAYDVLGDSKKRALYDQLRAGGGGIPACPAAAPTPRAAPAPVCSTSEICSASSSASSRAATAGASSATRSCRSPRTPRSSSRT